MLAIQTKFIGPTNNRGSRVKAAVMEPLTDSFGNKRRQLTMFWEHARDCEANHRQAALTLIKKLGWEESAWHVGGTDDGYVFVRQTAYSQLEQTGGVK